jgi:glycine dehydrogenase
VENGSLDKDDNPLKNAPHTAAELVGEWTHGTAASRRCTLPSLVEGKYWPPVGRVDNVFGDRNLVCACPSIESYQDA